MPWPMLVQLIIQEGLPLALKLAEKWGHKEPVSELELAELRALALQGASDRMKAQLVAANIPLDSEQGQALLALTK